MTEPTTPTGRSIASMKTRCEPCGGDPCGGRFITIDEICDIEREAVEPWQALGEPTATEHHQSDIAITSRLIEERDAERALADQLTEALRDAAAVAHETDSLRSHSDDERKDGWFRAPFERCEDVLCADARAALAVFEEARK